MVKVIGYGFDKYSLIHGVDVKLIYVYMTAYLGRELSEKEQYRSGVYTKDQRIGVSCSVTACTRERVQRELCKCHDDKVVPVC